MQNQCCVKELISRNISFPEKYSFQCSKLLKSAHLKKFVSILTLIIMFLFFQDQLFAQRKNQVRKVVIDAGHGGYDSGAKGKNSREKDIALAIALKTGNLIQKNCPGVEVIYTRESDVFVELYRRAQIANQNKADLFISIHCNANPSPLAFGTETYVMGLHKSEANLSVARAENASILLEDDYSARYDGFKPNSPEAYIIFSLFQNAYLDKSLNFASRVESSFTENTKLPERGVKQAGFLVLYKTTMPGVLIETGFLSNPSEEAFLNSSVGQDRLSYAIFRAFDDFKRIAEGNSPREVNAEDTLFRHHPPIINVQHEKIELALKADTFGYRGNSNNETVFNKLTLKEIERRKGNNTEKNLTAIAKKEKLIREIKQEKGNNIPDERTFSTIGNSEFDSKSDVTTSLTPGLKFRVQFFISPRAISFNSKVFKNIPNVKKYFNDRTYKYTAGDEATSNDAEQIRRVLAVKGYRDAFVLPFFNDNRITMKEAQEMIKNKH